MTVKVTVVGSLNMDLIVRSSHVPKSEETIIGATFQTAPGGKGANQAVEAVRFGGQVTLIGRVGEDTVGAELLQNLLADGVSERCVLRDAPAAARKPQ